MRIRNKKLLAFVLVVCLVLTQMVFASAAFAADNKDRLAGADRYSTAIAIAQAGWTTTGSEYAVLARGDDAGGGADALGAIPLAAKYKAPVLLTEPAALSNGVLQELKDLGVKTVLIVGGTGAVSKAVEDTLTTNGLTVKRFSGSDRFGTAMDIASKEFPTATDVALVYAYDFADALSISSYAGFKGMPVLLADKDYVPDTEKAYIAGKNVTVVGGNGVVGDTLFASLTKAVRYGGNDRYATNNTVLTNLTFDYSKIFIATGENFPDALAGAAFAAKTGAPIVLYSPTADGYSEMASKNCLGTSVVYALGGTAVVPQSVVDDLNADIDKKNVAKYIDKTSIENILPGIYVAKLYLTTGTDAADFTAKAGDITMTAAKTADGQNYFYAQVATAEVKVTFAKNQSLGTVDIPDGTLEGVVASTSMDSVLPGINLAKVVLKAGLDTADYKVVIDGTAMTTGSNPDGDKYFYAQVNAATAKAEVFKLNGLSVDVTIK